MNILHDPIKEAIREVPNFPKPGIIFKDITTLIANPLAFRETINQLARRANEYNPTYIVGPESRGFIFGVPVADRLNCGFIPVRKAGKLPGETISCTYDLEYGTDTLYMHKDAIKPGDTVVIIDDLLAIGGTLQACINLVEQLGGKVVLIQTVIELLDLNGKDKLRDIPFYSIVQYNDSERGE